MSTHARSEGGSVPSLVRRGARHQCSLRVDVRNARPHLRRQRRSRRIVRTAVDTAPRVSDREDIQLHGRRPGSRSHRRRIRHRRHPRLGHGRSGRFHGATRPEHDRAGAVAQAADAQAPGFPGQSALGHAPQGERAGRCRGSRQHPDAAHVRSAHRPHAVRAASGGTARCRRSRIAGAGRDGHARLRAGYRAAHAGVRHRIGLPQREVQGPDDGGRRRHYHDPRTRDAEPRRDDARFPRYRPDHTAGRRRHAGGG